MTSLIVNNVAGMVFDVAKSTDRVMITVYQSAAGNKILTWLQDAVDKMISALGKAIYFPYLAPVVILGAMWLAWQGLIRKRDPDHRGDAVDGGGRHPGQLADRQAGRPPSPGGDHGLQRRHPGPQRRLRQAARAGQQQLPAGRPG